MDPPPYQPVAGSTSSTGFAPQNVSLSASARPMTDASGTGSAEGEILRWDSLCSSSLPTDHPLHYTFQKDLDIKKDSIRVGLVEGDIYVSPGEPAVAVPGVRPVGTEGSGRLNGYVQVVSTSARKIKGVRVRLVRRLALAFPSGREEDDVVEKELVFGSGPDGLQLQKGLSIFEFRFSILANSAVHEDPLFAQTRHFIIASADGSASGWFASDLRAETPLWVFAAPISGEIESQRLAIHSEGVTDALGPFAYDLDASAFIVSSALSVKLVLHAPPPSLTIFGIKVYLVQEAALASHRTPGKTAAIKRPKQFIVNAGPSGPYDKTFSRAHRNDALLLRRAESGGEPWTFEQVARLPSDRDIRPTTHPATETNVRMTSRLFIDIVYTTADVTNPDSADSHKVWVATIFNKSVSLGSCACFHDRLALPDYKVGDTTSGFAQYAHLKTSTRSEYVIIVGEDVCLCNTPWEDILANEHHASQFSRAGLEDSVPKDQGRKHAETYKGDLDVVEGVEWERQDS